MSGNPLGTDPLSGVGTPGEPGRVEHRGTISALPRRGSPPPKAPPKGGSGGGAGAGRGGGGGDLDALDRRLAAIEKRVDSELADLAGMAPPRARKARTDREGMLEALRDLDARVASLAGATSRLTNKRPKGLFLGARNVTRLAGDLVTPDYYTRKLGEFGLRDRSVQVDEFGMDSVYRSSIRPVMEFLFRRWWRVRMEGLTHIPDRGAALLVGNHAGVVPYDAAMVAFGIENRHPAKRRVRFLIEDWFATLPFASPLIARAGAVRAHRENAERLLRTGHLVGAFPEGTKGSLKFYRNRYRVQRFGRGGSVRLAMQTGVPIIPFAVVGSEEIYPVMAKANWIAKAIGVGELPIAANALLGPLGAIPLPSKWIIRIGKPIPMAKHGAKGAANAMLVNKLTNEIRRRVQEMVDELLDKRKSIWRG